MDESKVNEIARQMYVEDEIVNGGWTAWADAPTAVKEGYRSRARKVLQDGYDAFERRENNAES